jgi:C4-dicarboxylate transporter, DctQ subunit
MSSETFIPGSLPVLPIAAAAPRRWAASLVDGAAGLFAFALVLVVLMQVAGRLNGTPVPWSEELTRAMFLWMVFLGLSSSMRSADAARVTVLLEKVPALRRLAMPVYLLSCLGFFALMAWTGLAMVRQQFLMNESIATLGCPSWLIGAVMPLSALIAAAGTLASLKDHRAQIAVAHAAGGRA